MNMIITDEEYEIIMECIANEIRECVSKRIEAWIKEQYPKDYFAKLLDETGTAITIEFRLHLELKDVIRILNNIREEMRDEDNSRRI